MLMWWRDRPIVVDDLMAWLVRAMRLVVDLLTHKALVLLRSEDLLQLFVSILDALYHLSTGFAGSTPISILEMHTIDAVLQDAILNP